jgi:hypothetical protein
MNKKGTPSSPHRPGTMLLSVLVIVASGTSLISYFFVVSGLKSLPPEQEMVLNNLTGLDIGLTLFINAAVFIAAIGLFLLRRIALYAFLGAFCAGVVKFGWFALNEGSLSAIFTSGAGRGALFLGLLLAACIHVWRLERHGILD